MALQFTRRFGLAPGLRLDLGQAGRERLGRREGRLADGRDQGRAHQPRSPGDWASTGLNRLAGPPGLVPLAAQ